MLLTASQMAIWFVYINGGSVLHQDNMPAASKVASLISQASNSHVNDLDKFK